MVTVEEHNIIGGLGSAVAEVISSEGIDSKLVMLGINDFVPLTGEYDYLLETCGLTANMIAEKIERMVMEI